MAILSARGPMPDALSGLVLEMSGRWSIKPKAVMGSRMPIMRIECLRKGKG